MSEGAVRWSADTNSIAFQISSDFLARDGRGLEPWIDEWRGDSNDGLALSYMQWAELGAPPTTDDVEAIDLFQARHSAASRLFGIATQKIYIESFGHVGSSELTFMLEVDGARLADAPAPTPLAKDGRGRVHPLVPTAFVVFQRVCEWNARGTSTRAQQIVFLSELRAHLDRATTALASSAVTFHYELDEHLGKFQASRPEGLAMEWAAQRNGAVFDLLVQQVDDRGQRRPLQLDRLDPDSPLVEVSATEHVLLDEDMAAVARVAKKQRNKLRKHVEAHFHDPSQLIPEGVSLDKVDLRSYSPRVLGFEPLKADRDIDILPSGIEWFDTSGEEDAAFLRLFIAQPGGAVETIALPTPEAAQEAVQQIDRALATPQPPVIDVGGKRVVPTRPLRDRIEREVAAYQAREAPSDVRPPKTGQLAAKIADSSDSAPISTPDADIPVPWDVLQTLLLPSCELKPHQREGVAWLWRQYKRGRTGVLLADDMGLGKTLQLSAFLALQRATEKNVAGSPSMIVAPVILLDNWREELAKFFRPEVFSSLLVLYGDDLRKRKKDGALDVNDVRAANYVLTNYETLQSHQLSLLQVDWNVVVLDEAQNIKNSDTARARAARGLKRRFGICSTGTPVENRLLDLWSLYDFLSPGDPFTGSGEFSSEFEADVDDGVRKARTKLSYPSSDSSLLRRTKDSALTLPPKSIDVRKVAMTPYQIELERQAVYRGRERGNILSTLQDLQKLYQHPRLLAAKGNRDGDLPVNVALEESPKLALCLDILRQIRDAREKALVFTIWTEMQALLVEIFREVLGLPRVRVINGDPKQRKRAQEFIREFSAADGFSVLVLSPLAAGTGLTITAANHVIHYGRWWNPAKEDQATDRAYRIGQTKPVHVHYPVLHHPGNEQAGFDVKLHELVTKKRAVARDFLAPQTGEDVSMTELAALEEN